MGFRNEIVEDDNGRPICVRSTQTTRGGKEIVTEHVCVPKASLEAPGKFLEKYDHNKYSGSMQAQQSRLVFRAGFIQALNTIDWTYSLFPDLPPSPQKDYIARKVIKIQGVEYFEDEVLERIKELPASTSIWRK